MKRFPYEIQRNAMDCGATCIRIIGRYYGCTIPLPLLRSITQTNRSGTSLLGLSKAAEEIGLRTMAAKVTFKKLIDEAPLPLILHWQQNHFVIVYKITKKRVFVSDPAIGLVDYSFDEFLTYWIGAQARLQSAQGAVLLLEPTPAFDQFNIHEEAVEEPGIAQFLSHYIRPHTKVMLQILLGLTIGVMLQLIVPFLTKNIVDTGIYKKDISFIWLVLIAQLLLTFGQMALELMRSWMMLFVSSRVNVSLLANFFKKLMRLPIRFFDNKLTGDLLQRINDHKRIETFLTNSSLTALFAIFTFLTYGGVLAYYNLSLFGIFLISSLLYVSWIFFFLKKREKLDYKNFTLESKHNSKVYELINGMREIKLHNAEQHKRWTWERIQIKLYKVSVQALSLEQTQQIGAKIINEIKNIFITVLAAKLVIEGQLTLGTMLAISYIVGQLNTPILQMVGIIKEWQNAKISVDRLAETDAEPDETKVVSATNGVQQLSSLNHIIKLENVSFYYDELSKSALTNLNLTIPSGQITAIVGASGSGKTTLLKLLMRFYEPQKGEIKIDNISLNTMNLRYWRQLCGVVMQEGFIFNDSIAGNIAIGEDQPDPQGLENACQIANIDTFIQGLPLGYQTKIGQEGIGISTGQKQRILIARAVYKNPDIIFFDEATSALDATNEREIMEKLQHFYKGKTVVIIAHRLSTVKNADKIVVLDKGEIIEQGTHSSLSIKKGYYYHLVKDQLAFGE